MALPINLSQRELSKFVEDSAGQVAVRVQSVIGGGTGTDASQVQGTAADNDAAVGNPIRVGAKYNSPTQTYANGDIADLQTDVNGNLKVTLATAISHTLDSITIYNNASTTGTTSSVNDSNSSQTLLTANTSRLGATIFNDSTVILYIKFGATASATDFTAKLNPGDYYEVPFGYTGKIDGIWASDASGAARITELT